MSSGLCRNVVPRKSTQQGRYVAKKSSLAISQNARNSFSGLLSFPAVGRSYGILSWREVKVGIMGFELCRLVRNVTNSLKAI